MKRYIVWCIVVLFIFVLLFIAANKLGLLFIIYKTVVDLTEQKQGSFPLTVFALMLNGLLMLLSTIIGYKLSRKKGRSPFTWVLLCLLFNIWAVIILWLLPSQERHKPSA